MGRPRAEGQRRQQPKKKEVNNEEASKGKDEPHNKTEGEGAEKEGPKGWAPWWPKSQGREGPPKAPVDMGTGA
jgi:hypothetical protein